MKSHWMTVIDIWTDRDMCECINCGKVCPVEYMKCPSCNAEMDNGLVEYKENKE